MLALLLAAACAHAPAGPATYLEEGGKVEPGDLLTPAGRPMALSALAQAAGGARFVLVGEGHENRCDHRVQARVIHALSQGGAHPAVGLEMVDVDRQPLLDRFGAGEIPLEELDPTLGFTKQWGVPFERYQPIFEEAQAHGAPLVALNLPREVVRTVSREGLAGLPADQKEAVPEPIPPLPEQEKRLRKAYEEHAEHLPRPPSEESFRRFLLVQSLWDTQMANEALQASARLDRPVVVLAGAGHVEYGWGIGHRLRTLAPGAEVIEIVPWRGDGPLDPDEGALFFYCPREE